MMWKLVAVLAALSAAQASVLSANLARSVPKNVPKVGIVGGQEAAPGQFPHQVGIWIFDNGGSQDFCGGSILTKNVVITAAHCVAAGTNFLLVFGAHDINANDVETRITQRKLVRGDFADDGAYSNDIALLYFTQPLEFNDRIQPVQLPTNEKKSYWNSHATMSGWGYTSDDDKMVTPTLHFLTSRVLTNFYCKARYFFKNVEDTNICVSGWWAKGACEGDSGGPLVVYEAGKPVLIGVTSFGINRGCEASWPSVFTRTTVYLDWILSGIALIGNLDE